MPTLKILNKVQQPKNERKSAKHEPIKATKTPTYI